MVGDGGDGTRLLGRHFIDSKMHTLERREVGERWLERRMRLVALRSLIIVHVESGLMG
jgi:hypothetical protein